MEAGPHNVRVNVVAPGAVETPGLDASVMKNEAMKKLMGDAIPMGRIGTADEMAEAICFMGSDDASFINGVILPVDGGKTPQLHVPDWELTLDNRDVK
jgi:NAD(P)-dependent dehydrogenase (short-subunit alcohol dehydrogenase family)